ncbi:MAG: hypothetical protein WC855_14325, partial [Thermodesulfovibrionales bacterium]
RSKICADWCKISFEASLGKWFWVPESYLFRVWFREALMSIKAFKAMADSHALIFSLEAIE